MTLLSVFIVWWLIATAWAIWKTKHEARKFERRFGARPGWRYFSIPNWKAGFAAPKNVKATPEMEQYLNDLNYRNWLAGGLQVIALIAIVGSWVLLRTIFPETFCQIFNCGG